VILGIGIDSVEIHRFNNWHSYSTKKLKKVFTQHEIDYCLSCKAKSAERFAVRFAAKEAFYKALCSFIPKTKISFFSMCKQASIRNTYSAPTLITDKSISENLPTKTKMHLSLTHSKTTATATIIVEAIK
jgi:holo-[acyl-carrier protein] synthase